MTTYLEQVINLKYADMTTAKKCKKQGQQNVGKTSLLK